MARVSLCDGTASELVSLEATSCSPPFSHTNIAALERLRCWLGQPMSAWVMASRSPFGATRDRYSLQEVASSTDSRRRSSSRDRSDQRRATSVAPSTSATAMTAVRSARRRASPMSGESRTRPSTGPAARNPGRSIVPLRARRVPLPRYGAGNVKSVPGRFLRVGTGNRAAAASRRARQVDPAGTGCPAPCPPDIFAPWSPSAFPTSPSSTTRSSSTSSPSCAIATRRTRDFKQLVSEIAMLMAYEVTKDLPTEPLEIETPLERMVGTPGGGQEAGARAHPARRARHGGRARPAGAVGARGAHRPGARPRDAPAARLLLQDPGHRGRPGLLRARPDARHRRLGASPP